MKYFICEGTGSVYWKEDGEIHYAPLSADNKRFNTEDGGLVEVWDEVSVEDRSNIERNLA